MATLPSLSREGPESKVLSRSPSSQASLGLIKALGPRPGTSPPRIPGARALGTQLVCLLPAGLPPAAARPAAPAARTRRGQWLPRLSARPRGLQMVDPPGSPEPAGPRRVNESAHAPESGLTALGLALRGGARRSSGQHWGGRAGGGELLRLLCISQLGAPLHSLRPAGLARAARRRPRPLGARALARPARVPRAPPLCESLTSPPGLPGSV